VCSSDLPKTPKPLSTYWHQKYLNLKDDVFKISVLQGAFERHHQDWRASLCSWASRADSNDPYLAFDGKYQRFDRFLVFELAP
jgi:hypothetical protein